MSEPLFSHVEHQEPIRAAVPAIPLHEAGPWSVWLGSEDYVNEGWEQ